jgi:hypothetical protein
VIAAENKSFGCLVEISELSWTCRRAEGDIFRQMDLLGARQKGIGMRMKG